MRPTRERARDGFIKRAKEEKKGEWREEKRGRDRWSHEGRSKLSNSEVQGEGKEKKGCNLPWIQEKKKKEKGEGVAGRRGDSAVIRKRRRGGLTVPYSRGRKEDRKEKTHGNRPP